MNNTVKIILLALVASLLTVFIFLGSWSELGLCTAEKNH